MVRPEGGREGHSPEAKAAPHTQRIAIARSIHGLGPLNVANPSSPFSPPSSFPPPSLPGAVREGGREIDWQILRRVCAGSSEPSRYRTTCKGGREGGRGGREGGREGGVSARRKDM